MANEIMREAAIAWINGNTTFDTSINPLPANIELFIGKYEEVMNIRPGVVSESISGLSQSFNTSDISALLKQYASGLIGEEYLVSEVRFVSAENRFK